MKKDVVAHEDVYKGAKLGGLRTVEEITNAMAAIIPTHLTVNDVVFVCIGTDRSTGDSLGPLVGTYLSGIGYTNVYGTLDEPTHAMNLTEVVAGLPADRTVIAIDASLGQVTSVGTTQVINGPLKPGAGVGRDLCYVGEYAIAPVVNAATGNIKTDYLILNNTRLAVVMRLAKDITSAIVNTFPLSQTAGRVISTTTTTPELPKKKRGRPSKVKVTV